MEAALPAGIGAGIRGLMRAPLAQLAAAGQSVWLDSLSRELLASGELARWIAENGLTGLTSNPAIFEKAVSGSPLYAAAIRARLDAGDAEPGRLYEELAVEDIRAAADLFLPVWRARGGRDGFVSLEVSPHLLRDPAGTIAEGVGSGAQSTDRT